jgi:voltage-gated potassium channel
VTPIIAVLAAIFLAEFFARLWDAPSRVEYFRHHWIDLASSIPLIGGLRGLRLLSLLRLGAVMRIISVVDREADEHGIVRHSLWFVGPCLIFIWFVAGMLFWHFEHDVNAKIVTFGDALYWAFITTTTIGYGGDITPVTSEARIVAGLLIFFGIGLVSLASAQLTQRWLRHEDSQTLLVRKHESLELKIDHLESHLDEMRSMLARLDASNHPPGASEAPSPSAAAVHPTDRG